MKTQVFKGLPHLYVIFQIYTSLPLLLWKPRLQQKFDCQHSEKVSRHNRVRLSVPLIQGIKKASVSAHSLTKSTQNTQTTNRVVYFFFLCCFRVDKVSVCHFDAFQGPGLLKLCMLFCLVWIGKTSIWNSSLFQRKLREEPTIGHVRSSPYSTDPCLHVDKIYH